MENEIKEGLESIKTQVNEKYKDLENRIDALSVQSKGKQVSSNEVKTLPQALYNTLTEKATELKNLVNDKLTVKSIFTTDVTGKYPNTTRDAVVLSEPTQLVNVSQLISTVAIEGGAYSYAVETTTGAPEIQAEGETKASISTAFEYKTATTEFLAGITEVSRQFLNNYTSLASSIPSILAREYFKAENALYSAELFDKATPSVITGSSEVEVIVKELSDMFSKNITPNVVVLNPENYTNILLNQTSLGYDLPNAMTVSSTGQVTILGVNVLMATWVGADQYLIFNGSSILDIVQSAYQLQVDNSEKFSKNISIFRIEKQSNIVVLAPYQIRKGTFGGSPSV